MTASAAIITGLGALSEPNERAGTASLWASLMCHSTTRGSGDASAFELEAWGASVMPLTNWDVSGLTIDALQDTLQPALLLVAEAFRTPKLTEKDTTALGRSRFLRLNGDLRTTRSAALGYLREATFPTHRLGLGVQGTPASNLGIGFLDLTSFHDSSLRSGLTLVVVGDLDRIHLDELGHALFAATTDSALPSARIGSPIPNPTSGLTIVGVPVPSPLCTLAASAPVKTSTVTTELALAVAEELLVGSVQALIPVALRNKLGNSYAIRSNIERFSIGSVLTMAFETAPRNCAETLREVCHAQTSLRQGWFAHSDVARAKSAAIHRLAHRWWTSSLACREAARDLALGYRSRALDVHQREWHVIPLDVIERALADVFAQDNTSLVVAGALEGSDLTEVQRVADCLGLAVQTCDP